MSSETSQKSEGLMTLRFPAIRHRNLVLSSRAVATSSTVCQIRSSCGGRFHRVVLATNRSTAPSFANTRSRPIALRSALMRIAAAASIARRLISGLVDLVASSNLGGGALKGRSPSWAVASSRSRKSSLPRRRINSTRGACGGGARAGDPASCLAAHTMTKLGNNSRLSIAGRRLWTMSLPPCYACVTYYLAVVPVVRSVTVRSLLGRHLGTSRRPRLGSGSLPYADTSRHPSRLDCSR